MTLRIDVAEWPAELPPDGRIEVTMQIANTGAVALAVSHKVQRYFPSPDGTRLDVSTIRPQPPEGMTFAIGGSPVLRVDPGASRELKIALRLPLLVTTLEGKPPRGVTREWWPATNCSVSFVIGHARATPESDASGILDVPAERWDAEQLPPLQLRVPKSPRDEGPTGPTTPTKPTTPRTPPKSPTSRGKQGRSK